MTTYFGKSCSFCLPRVPFVNCRQFSYFPFGFEGRIWDLIVSVPDHCLSFYFDMKAFLGQILLHHICIVPSKPAIVGEFNPHFPPPWPPGFSSRLERGPGAQFSLGTSLTWWAVFVPTGKS